MAKAYVEAEAGLLEDSTPGGLSWNELAVVEEVEVSVCDYCCVPGHHLEDTKV